MLANVLNMAADLVAIGQGMHLLHAGPATVWAVIGGIAITALVVSGSFETIAKVFKILCLSLVSYLIVLAVTHVDWGAVVRNLLIPHITWSAAYFGLLIGVLGTTISPYLFFWQSANRIEELRAEPEGGEQAVTLDERSSAQARLKVKTSRLDVLFGMTLSNLVMFAIIVATGATLGADGGQKISSAADAAKALEPIAGSLASVVFALGFVGSGFLAVPVLAGSGSSAMAGLLNKRLGLLAQPSQGAGVLRPRRRCDDRSDPPEPVAREPDRAPRRGRGDQRRARRAVRRHRDAHRGRRADHGRSPQRSPRTHAGLAHLRAHGGSSDRAVRDPAVTCALRRFWMTTGRRG